jgi:hypothetical protein
VAGRRKQKNIIAVRKISPEKIVMVRFGKLK